MIVELVYAQVFWRNMFALKGGVSTTQSPAEIILNRKLDFNTHCKVEFGEYVQTHKEHDNSMNTRTVGAIATRPTGNVQGGYYFIRIDTGRRINRKDWTSLPMPETVIDQVHRLALSRQVIGPLAIDLHRAELRRDLLDLADESLERFAFYERAQTAAFIVATTELRIYGNVILKKGVVYPEEVHRV